MSVTIRKKTKIAINKINELIDEVIGFSGGFPDDELMLICAMRVEENFQIKEEKIKSMFGKNGVYDPVKRRMELNPPTRMVTTLTPGDICELIGTDQINTEELKYQVQRLIQEYIEEKEGYNEHFFDNEHDALCDVMKNIKIVLEY